MSAITVAILTITNVIIGDMFDFSIRISGIDLSAKTLKSQWRENWDTAAVLTFQESDGTLTKTVTEQNVTVIRFYQPATATANLKDKTYKLSIIMSSNASDIQTLVIGTAAAVHDVTER